LKIFFRLIASRKKRKPPPGYVTVAELKSFTSKDTISSLHSPSPAGVTAFSLSRSESSRFVSGGNDKIVQVYDRSAGKVLVSLKGHTKKVNFVDWREKEGETTLIMSGSADKTSRIWAQDPGSGDYAPTHTIKTHKGEITGLALHPTATILGLSSLDKTYSLHDLSTFQSIYHSPASDTPYTSLAIHPDGLLLGLGSSSSTLQIYDIRAGTIAASLTPADASPFTVNTFSFSENGYNLAAPDSKSSVAIWDLRKLSTVHSIKLEESFNIHKIRYDYSAQYIGIAGTGVRVFQQKTWEELLRVDEAKEVTDLAFGANGQEILFATGREVKTWASKDA
jgi:pre-mRNA-processing factor 19